jgi:urease accessory protein
VYVSLPRGTLLQEGDLLCSDAETTLVRVFAKPEPVMTVHSTTGLGLLKAAYHLGNRHVSLEIASDYLRFSPDPVLKSMLEQMGLRVKDDIVAFHPESGAYGHSHAH